MSLTEQLQSTRARPRLLNHRLTTLAASAIRVQCGLNGVSNERPSKLWRCSLAKGRQALITTWVSACNKESDSAKMMEAQFSGFARQPSRATLTRSSTWQSVWDTARVWTKTKIRLRFGVAKPL